jgi:hypothetical protein
MCVDMTNYLEAFFYPAVDRLREVTDRMEGPNPYEPVADVTKKPASESIWLGDLAGFRIVPGDDLTPAMLECRCDKQWPIDPYLGYLANLIADHVIPHRREGCDPDD